MKALFVDPERCLGCKTCEIACALNRSSVSRQLPDAIYERVAPLARVRVSPTGGTGGFPIQCRHCENAPCMDACPSGAMSRDAEGLVVSDEARCVGCWMCVMVCPFGAPRPFRASRTMIKCDRCRGMDAPYCVEACPTHALALLDPEALASGACPLTDRARVIGLALGSAKTSASSGESRTHLRKDP